MTYIKRSNRAKPDPELVKLADSLLANYTKPEDLIGENVLLKQRTKMLVERALEVELTDHLGHSKSGDVTNDTANTRNGHSATTLKGHCHWIFLVTVKVPLNCQTASDIYHLSASKFFHFIGLLRTIFIMLKPVRIVPGFQDIAMVRNSIK